MNIKWKIQIGWHHKMAVGIIFHKQHGYQMKALEERNKEHYAKSKMAAITLPMSKLIKEIDILRHKQSLKLYTLACYTLSVIVCYQISTKWALKQYIKVFNFCNELTASIVSSTLSSLLGALQCCAYSGAALYAALYAPRIGYHTPWQNSRKRSFSLK